MSRILLIVGVILAAGGFLNPSLSLAAGIAYGAFVPNEADGENKMLAKFLLQASVVCMGFGMNFQDVLRVSKDGLGFTVAAIAFALLSGMLIGRLLLVQRTQSLLISVGTAICGGSAIAAVGPILNADEEQMAVSLGVVFVLNAVALFLFPQIGAALHLTQAQFGLWAALAIHDTSSVVGASAKFGREALFVGTTVKLARAMWIVPISLGIALVNGTRTKIRWPWFILLFCVAVIVNSYEPVVPSLYQTLSQLGKAGLAVTLFYIGTGVNPKSLRKMGVRPMLQGVLLWMIVATASLWAIRSGYVKL